MSVLLDRQQDTTLPGRLPVDADAQTNAYLQHKVGRLGLVRLDRRGGQAERAGYSGSASTRP